MVLHELINGALPYDAESHLDREAFLELKQRGVSSLKDLDEFTPAGLWNEQSLGELREEKLRELRRTAALRTACPTACDKEGDGAIPRRSLPNCIRVHRRVRCHSRFHIGIPSMGEMRSKLLPGMGVTGESKVPVSALPETPSSYVGHPWQPRAFVDGKSTDHTESHRNCGQLGRSPVSFGGANPQSTR